MTRIWWMVLHPKLTHLVGNVAFVLAELGER